MSNQIILRPIESLTKEEIANLTAEERQAYEDAYDYGAVDYSDMVRQLAKSGDAILESLTPKSCEAVHMAACLPGECGEIWEIVVDATLFLKPLDYGALIKDYGDLAFYAEGTLQVYGLTLDEVLETGTPNERLATLIERLRNEPVVSREARLEMTSAALTIACGEVWDTAKREVIYCKPLDRQRLINGLKALYALLFIAASDQTWTFEDVLLENKRKLAGPFGRYKLSEGYTDKSAQERADEANAKA